MSSSQLKNSAQRVASGSMRIISIGTSIEAQDHDGPRNLSGSYLEESSDPFQLPAQHRPYAIPLHQTPAQYLSPVCSAICLAKPAKAGSLSAATESFLLLYAVTKVDQDPIHGGSVGDFTAPVS